MIIDARYIVCLKVFASASGFFSFIIIFFGMTPFTDQVFTRYILTCRCVPSRYTERGLNKINYNFFFLLCIFIEKLLVIIMDSEAYISVINLRITFYILGHNLKKHIYNVKERFYENYLLIIINC